MSPYCAAMLAANMRASETMRLYVACDTLRLMQVS